LYHVIFIPLKYDVAISNSLVLPTAKTVNTDDDNTNKAAIVALMRQLLDVATAAAATHHAVDTKAKQKFYMHEWYATPTILSAEDLQDMDYNTRRRRAWSEGMTVYIASPDRLRDLLREHGDILTLAQHFAIEILCNIE